MRKYYVIIIQIIADTILIATGEPYENGKKTEIIDLLDPANQFELSNDYNESVISRSVGGTLQDQLYIFGGVRHEDFLKDVLVIGQPDSTTKLQMLQNRSQASSVILNNSTFWVVGGERRNSQNDSIEDLTSTEFISRGQPPKPGPDLPFSISNHGMVQCGSASIYIIGGWQNGSESKATWIVNPVKDFHVRPGPSLNLARYHHSCGTMEIQGRTVIIVAGGWHEDTVELLDPLSNKGWIYGTKSKI